ncbi:dihydrolipoamide acetyltransferase family protein [Clostridiaceae bacterium 35-E11]
MAEIIIMPKLGFNMDEGQLVRWNKNQGDKVSKGEVLFEINTDKTTMPVESTLDGVVLKTMLEEGAFAPVFTPIAVVGNEGEDADAVLAAAGEETVTAPIPQENEEAAVQDTQQMHMATDDLKSLKLTPKAKKFVKEEGIDPTTLTGIKGTGFRGGITAKDIKASPLARKLAEKTGVDLANVQGTGTGGKVMKADVEKATATSAPDIALKDRDDKKILSVTPYKGVRKIIGDRLSQSKFTAPHLYFTDSIDTTNLTAFRKQLNAMNDTKIAVSDLLILAASKALQKYPEVNASLVDEQIICYKSTNVGMAVAGDNGLIVPVVKNAQEKSLTQIAKKTRELVEKAKTGKLAQDEYTGGTFSISNLGMFGIENFTAIINPPESAILSVSSVRKTPVVVTDENGEDTVVIRPIMNIQLSVDHRIIDGLLAAKFVGYMKELLEEPIKILI